MKNRFEDFIKELRLNCMIADFDAGAPDFVIASPNLFNYDNELGASSR